MLGAVAGILTYFAYNGIVFGGIVPVSGAVKRDWSQARWEAEGGYSFTQNFRDVLQIPAFDGELLAALAICALFPLAWWLARRSRRREDWLFLVFMVGAFGLAAGHLAKFADTALFVHPQWGSYVYYFVPAYLMMALLVPLGCFAALHLLRRFAAPRLGRAAGMLSLAAVIAGAGFLFLNTSFAQPFRFVEQASQDTAMDWELTSYAGAQTMNRLLSPGNVAGSRDAGVIGYFSRSPVVNLDGVVNSYTFLRGWQAGEDLEALSRKFGITHFANVWWEPEREAPGRMMLPNILPEERNPDLNPGHAALQGPGFFTPGRRIFFVHTGWWRNHPAETPPGEIAPAAQPWETLEPHFIHTGDGVGVLVDGRLAQAFFRGCPSEELWEKAFVVSWRDGGTQEWAGSGWFRSVDIPGNRSVLCAAALILPKDAAPPYEVEIITVGDYVRRLTAEGRLAISSDFDVYLNGRNLIYVRSQCSSDDVAARFFLHLFPGHRNDLHEHSRQHGFNNLDFRFQEWAVATGEECAAIRQLPDYPLREIRTGQFTPGEGRIWQGRFKVHD